MFRALLEFHSNPGSSHQTQHARNIQIVVCAAPPEDEQVVLETCKGCQFIINLIKTCISLVLLS
jgi:hypothetical protein